MKSSILAMALCVWAGSSLAQTDSKPQFIDTGASSELYVSDAVFYPADGTRAVVWVPGFIFNKESWAKMAKALQEKNVASIAISGKLEKNVRQAIRELVRRGYKDVVLVGGSSGGAAVLNTMEQVTAIDVVSAVAMLSPVRGNPMDDQPVRKLFMVSEQEKSYDKVLGLYEGSMEPKDLITFPGNAHAQFLFFGPTREQTTEALINFITQ